MSKPLSVLMVEDNPDDAELAVRELTSAGYSPTWERVDTAAAMKAALASRPWDVVISDYAMPSFNALEALGLVREQGLSTPFLIVSGTIGEDTAVAAMRAGARDYLMKGDLKRLGPAVERELEEAAERLERRAAEEQLRLSDRMVSIGMIVSGVGHEINNPLTVVLASLEFLGNELERGVPSPADLSVLKQATTDGYKAGVAVKRIVQDLRVFSRRNEDKIEPVDLAMVLDSSARMAANEIRHRAALVKDYQPVRPVDANEARLGQVFLNLLVNAAHAIPPGRAAENEIRISLLPHGERVVVEVRDTGQGMSPEVLARAFEPFFTTKAPGVGTGLGLAICRRIISGMGGTIEALSEPGKGSRLVVSLPASRAGSVGARELEGHALGSPVAPGPGERRRRVLVIDDEPKVLGAISRVLESRYEVVSAESSRRALQELKREEFDAVVCDLMMPEMTGMELHALVAASSPSLADRFLFVTGGVFTEEGRAFVAAHSGRVLEKPLETRTLLALLEGTVSRAPRS